MAPLGPVAPAMIACKLPKEALPPPRSPLRSPPPLLPAARTGIAPCDQAYSMPAVIGAEMPPLPPRSGIGPDAVRGHQDVARQVFVVEVDARVDDADLDACSGAGGPGRRGPDLGEAPLLGKEWVVRGKCRAGKRYGEGTSHHDRARRQ